MDLGDDQDSVHVFFLNRPVSVLRDWGTMLLLEEKVKQSIEVIARNPVIIMHSWAYEHLNLSLHIIVVAHKQLLTIF